MMSLKYDIQIHIICQSKLVKSTFICKIIAFYMFIRIRKISTCLNNHLNSGLKQFSLTCSILYLTWLFVLFLQIWNRLPCYHTISFSMCVSYWWKSYWKYFHGCLLSRSCNSGRGGFLGLMVVPVCTFHFILNPLSRCDVLVMKNNTNSSSISPLALIILFFSMLVEAI